MYQTTIQFYLNPYFCIPTKLIVCNLKDVIIWLRAAHK